MSSEIHAKIGKDGKIRIDGIKGTFGSACEKLTESLEKHGKVTKKENVFVEAFIHNLARDIQGHACEQNQAYERFGGKDEQVSSYGDWPVGGAGRTIITPDVLWHNRNGPEDYASAAQKYNLPYNILDFSNPDLDKWR